MHREDFISSRQRFRNAWNRNNTIIVWAALVVFALMMAASVLVPIQDRWIFVVATAGLLLAVLIFSSRINESLLRGTDMKCPHCQTIFYEGRAEIVLASGNCPECGQQVIREATPLIESPSSDGTGLSKTTPHTRRDPSDA